MIKVNQIGQKLKSNRRLITFLKYDAEHFLNYLEKDFGII